MRNRKSAQMGQEKEIQLKKINEVKRGIQYLIFESVGMLLNS